MHFLFLFIDGVGLGPNDPQTNPLARAALPNLLTLLGGCKLVRDTINQHGEAWTTDQATLLPLDPILGVDGPPQSASGQAAILTGINIPKILGYHYGPKPNTEIKAHLIEGTIFHHLTQRGFRTALLNAYPQTYFDRINSKRGIPGAVAMAVQSTGIPLKTTEDMISGSALSADFTGEGWRDRLKIPNVPIYSLYESGRKLAEMSRSYDFAFFEYWLSDYAGHRADMEQSCRLLESFDAMLGGLIEGWRDTKGLIFITSDHGNLEDITTRKHTYNAVPGLVVGPAKLRQVFTSHLHNLADIAPSILKLYD